MLKALKWVYDLGKRHERIRIASELHLHSTSARNTVGVANDMFREEMSKSRPNKKRLERLEFEVAVSGRVDEIIQELFHSQGEWVYGTSIMFPDDLVNNNKEKK